MTCKISNDELAQKILRGSWHPEQAINLLANSKGDRIVGSRFHTGVFDTLNKFGVFIIDGIKNKRNGQGERGSNVKEQRYNTLQNEWTLTPGQNLFVFIDALGIYCHMNLVSLPRLKELESLFIFRILGRHVTSHFVEGWKYETMCHCLWWLYKIINV